MTPPSRAADPAPGRFLSPDFLTELFHNPLDPGYADAASRRARLGPRTGWRRGSTRTLALLTVGVLGFLLVIAYRQTVAEAPGRTQARAGLVAQVHRRQVQTDTLQQRADRLREEVAGLRDAALSGTAAARLRDLEAATGFARVRGPGVVIQLADSAAPADAVTGDKPDLGKVFDRDLQDLANALWGLGAEAIAINGQRLTTTSTIRAAGEAILVGYRPVTGPYEVSAVGPEELERRFSATPTARLFRRLVGEEGMSFEVRRVDDVVLPAAAEPQLRYARTPPGPSPVPGSGAPTPASTGRSGSPDPVPATREPTSSLPEGGR